MARVIVYSRQGCHLCEQALAVVAAVCEGGVEWLATEAVEPSVPADVWHAQRLREGASGLAATRTTSPSSRWTAG